MKWKLIVTLLAIIVVASGFVLAVQAYTPDTSQVAQVQFKPPTVGELLSLSTQT